MTRCPRCGDQVDRLEPIPVESLRSGIGEGNATGGDATRGQVCHWCRHEILEK